MNSLDALAVDLKNDIAFFQSGLCGGAVFIKVLYFQTLIVIEFQRFHPVVRQLRDPYTQIAAVRHLTESRGVRALLRKSGNC